MERKSAALRAVPLQMNLVINPERSSPSPPADRVDIRHLEGSIDGKDEATADREEATTNREEATADGEEGINDGETDESVASADYERSPDPPASRWCIRVKMNLSIHIAGELDDEEDDTSDPNYGLPFKFCEHVQKSCMVSLSDASSHGGMLRVPSAPRRQPANVNHRKHLCFVSCSLIAVHEEVD